MRFNHVTLGLALLAGLGLSACATLKQASALPANPPVALNQAHLSSLKLIDGYLLTGRLAIRTEKQGYSTSIRWQHSPVFDHIALYTPLGAQAALIEIEPNKQATLLASDGKSYSAQDAGRLLEKTLGWSVPLDGLADWVLGKPSPLTANTEMRWDDAGRILSMTQAGWQIEYPAYQQVNNINLPSKVVLKSQKLDLKLVVESWDVERDGIAHDSNTPESRN